MIYTKRSGIGHTIDLATVQKMQFQQANFTLVDQHVTY